MSPLTNHLILVLVISLVIEIWNLYYTMKRCRKTLLHLVYFHYSVQPNLNMRSYRDRIKLVQEQSAAQLALSFLCWWVISYLRKQIHTIKNENSWVDYIPIIGSWNVLVIHQSIVLHVEKEEEVVSWLHWRIRQSITVCETLMIHSKNFYHHAS